jgi:hypothetical protein
VKRKKRTALKMQKVRGIFIALVDSAYIPPCDNSDPVTVLSAIVEMPWG